MYTHLYRTPKPKCHEGVWSTGTAAVWGLGPSRVRWREDPRGCWAQSWAPRCQVQCWAVMLGAVADPSPRCAGPGVRSKSRRRLCAAEEDGCRCAGGAHHEWFLCSFLSSCTLKLLQ